jgi:Tfp pilus assembly PilM family ATPase
MAERRIGLHIHNNTLRAVEIEHRPGFFVLTAVAEHRIERSLPDRIETISEDERNTYINEFTNGLNAILHDHRFRAIDISLAIDIRNAFIQTLPFNGDYSEENVKDIIRWELSNYFPGLDGTSFLFDTYNPGFNPSRDKSPELIYIAVLKSYIHLFQEGIRRLNLRLHSINVDHFTIENIFKLERKDANTERLLAVCFYYDTVLYCSLLWNNRLIKYREHTIGQDSELPLSISKFLLTSIPPTKNTVQSLYVFPMIPDIGELGSISQDWKLTHLSPFPQIKKSWRIKRLMKKQPVLDEVFAPAIGAALHR